MDGVLRQLQVACQKERERILIQEDQQQDTDAVLCQQQDSEAVPFQELFKALERYFHFPQDLAWKTVGLLDPEGLEEINIQKFIHFLQVVRIRDEGLPAPESGAVEEMPKDQTSKKDVHR